MNWYATLNEIIWAGYYIAFLSWAALALIVARHLIKRDYRRFRIALLYVLNSLTFILAWGMVFRLAVILATPILETRQGSIDVLRNESRHYLLEHLGFAFAVAIGFAALNALYMRFVVKESVVRHALILLGADVLILFSAVYVSVEYYYVGMLQEIGRNFL